MTTQDKIDIIKEFIHNFEMNSATYGAEVMSHKKRSNYNNAKQWLAELEKQKELVNIVKSFVE